MLTFRAAPLLRIQLLLWLTADDTTACAALSSLQLAITARLFLLLLPLHLTNSFR
jgi:hypothetical protein